MPPSYTAVIGLESCQLNLHCQHMPHAMSAHKLPHFDDCAT